MAQLEEYKCPNCGGSMEFDSTLQKLKCPYCDSEFDIDELESQKNEDLSKNPDDMRWNIGAGGKWRDGEADAIRLYICRSCGGEIATDATTAASKCSYCGNAVTMTGNLSGELRPDFVIPFKLDKDAAKLRLSEHYKGKRLLPKVFKDQNHIDEIKGIYVPFWLFNTDADADITYHATKTKAWSDSKYHYVRTSHYDCYRSGSVAFTSVPVDGSTKMADDLMESIEPFDMSEAVEFQAAYLSGYLADKYDVSAEESINRANRRIKTTTERVLASSVTGYESVSAKSSSVRLQNGTTSYALLPVWVLMTKWKNKKYIFAMNGQTGKFTGDLPVDKGAYLRWFWLLAAGFTALFSALIFLFLYM